MLNLGPWFFPEKIHGDIGACGYSYVDICFVLTTWVNVEFTSYWQVGPFGWSDLQYKTGYSSKDILYLLTVSTCYLHCFEDYTHYHMDRILQFSRYGCGLISASSFHNLWAGIWKLV